MWCHLHWFQVWTKCGATCISSNFGHQVALLALFVNVLLAPPGGATCNGYKSSHQMALLELVRTMVTKSAKSLRVRDTRTHRSDQGYLGPIKIQIFEEFQKFYRPAQTWAEAGTGAERILRCLGITRGGSWALHWCHNHRQHYWPPPTPLLFSLMLLLITNDATDYYYSATMLLTTYYLPLTTFIHYFHSGGIITTDHFYSPVLLSLMLLLITWDTTELRCSNTHHCHFVAQLNFWLMPLYQTIFRPSW